MAHYAEDNDDAYEHRQWPYIPAAERRPPSESTDAIPGSPQKVEILKSRWASGSHLYHAQDRQFPVRKAPAGR